MNLVVICSYRNCLLLSITLLFLHSASCEKAIQNTTHGGRPSGTRRPVVDPEMLKHLRQLFLEARQLGRPLVNGEMNLLPEGAKGFASSVRCYSNISAASVMRDTSRVLQFNLSNLSISDTIVAVDIVLKQPLNFTSYRTQLHEIVGEESSTWQDLELRDTGNWEGQWHTLHVENMLDSIDPQSRQRNYQLSLSVTHIEEEGSSDDSSVGTALKEDDLLEIVKPMLLVYTNSLSLTSESLGTRIPPALEISNLTTTSPGKEIHTRPGRVRKRRSANPQHQRSAAEPSLDEMAGQACRKHVRYMTFQELGWPGNDSDVIAPTLARFSFCYGECNRPNQREYADFYTNHAKVISLAKPDLGISPCCVPSSYIPIDITYRDIFTDVITETTFPEVSSCMCM